MRARKAFEVLDAIREVHRQLAAHYRGLDEESSDEQMKLLLEDMEEREAAFDDFIGQYTACESSVVLETWLPVVPDELIRLTNLAERLAAPRTPAELVEETLQLNSRMCDAYLEMAKQAPSPTVQDLFTKLAQLEEDNDCHYARVLLGIEE